MTPASPWWRTAVIYQIYVRSFADGTGDGYGDIAGIRHRLPYLADLGVDGLWITPWYPSPMADGGYDVSDYGDIDSLFGSLADADALIRETHDLGLRVILDLVPNHTSEQHPWFVAALRDGPGSQARARYIFRDGLGENGDQPPNNWISAFGGGAWTRLVGPDGRAEQWYLHTFAPEQPDLNWSDRGVLESFDEIIRFWLDRGVDGLRLDAVPAMVKADGLPDADYGGDLRFLSSDWVDNPHWDTPGVHEIFRRWRRISDGYPGDRAMVAEAVVSSEERLADYVRGDELHTAFNFQFLKSPWDATSLRRVIDATLAAHARVGAPPTWALSNHDEIRTVTRYGRRTTSAKVFTDGEGEVSDEVLGLRRARAAALLVLALPGSAYLYQGDELGLPQVTDLPDEVLQDPVFRRTNGQVRGRDGCRVPMPWEGDAPGFGFSAGSPDPRATPWLPQPASWAALSVRAQSGEADSTLTLHRRALRLRRRLLDPTQPEPAEPGPIGRELSWRDDAPAGVLDFTRGTALRCVVNLSPDPVVLDPADSVVLSSSTLGTDPSGRTILAPDTAAWLTSPRPPGEEPADDGRR